MLVSAGQGDQPLYARLWGSGFLDSKFQGVQFRPGKDPVLYLSNPDGICSSGRQAMLDELNELNRQQFESELDPEIESRIAQYEMAYRMQTSVPEVTDLSDESESTFKMYGPTVASPARSPPTACSLGGSPNAAFGSFSSITRAGISTATCPRGIPTNAKRPIKHRRPLVKDLKQRGMLDDTLVIWGGEFGRTSYSQGTLTADNYGRDHHPRCFTIWLAGGGIKPGITYGRTDEYGYNIADGDGNPIQPTKDKFTPGAVYVTICTPRFCIYLASITRDLRTSIKDATSA